MNSESDTTGPIDAVIVWVDGNDPDHRSRRMQALSEEGPATTLPIASRGDDTRFLDNGELRFCIASIRTFAPWIRNIYLATDRQCPDYLTREVQQKYNISLVDHTEIFADFEWALPTFNTRTIETALWRIPGLSEKFIYFNDDFVITAPVRQTDFFVGDKIVARGAWNRMKTYGRWYMFVSRMANYLSKKLLGITRTMHLLLQVRSAELAGLTRNYFRVDHVPHPVHKPALESFFEENPGLFEQNIRYRFRDIGQFSAIFLAYYLKIARDEAILVPPDDVMMVHGEMDRLMWLGRKIRRIERQEMRFLSLQAIEKMDAGYRQQLEKVLSELTGLDF
ncbi:MAG: hypothetical protein EA363_12765 [Balneolaceae bacterium]|nr:MAG: hypothetical protein EA363_12765 [Balneolaceae bacterium]